MIKKILTGVAVVIIALAVFVAVQPDEYRIERSVVISAAPAKIFPSLNNLQKWEEWSPWAKLDPAATMTWGDKTAGKGASMGWDGNDKVGKGTVTITESEPGKTLRYDLLMEKPMAGTSQAEFLLTADDAGGTKVTWAMYGTHDFAGKAMWIFLCSHMIGPVFEEGLANLKAKIEG